MDLASTVRDCTICVAKTKALICAFVFAHAKKAVFLMTRLIYVKCRLSDQGHDVVGNEAVAMGCQQFFEEHNIPYKMESIPGLDGEIYTVCHHAIPYP